MKVLILSDTHFYEEFDQVRFDYIAALLKTADKVIINGDFWDGYLVSFDQFVNSNWNQLFPLLKKKQAIYLYGNHDLPQFADERVSLFSVQQDQSYELVVAGQKYIIQHGHRVAPEFDARHPRLVKFISQHLPFLARAVTLLDPGEHFWAKIYKKLYLNYGHLVTQAKMLKYVAAHPDQQSIFIFGHCHLPLQAPDKRVYIPGEFWAGHARYLIIEDGKIQSFDEVLSK